MAQTRSNRKILVLPGDGIGPEIMGEVMRVIEFFDRRNIARFDVGEGLVGGAAYDASGVPLTDETLAQAQQADAVLFGSVGGPKWESLPFELQPERGLLRLRKEMDLFANLRPAVVFDALADASALKRELVAGLDLMIVRELTGGIYFGDPRGIETLPDGSRRGINTEVYTEAEIERVVRVGFDLARKRQRRLTEVDKANVMESGVLWREVARRVHADYPDVELSFMYADNCAMQLVRQPKQFDVIVTSNLFGDILSDCAAMLTGSLGMLPSASLGAPDATGRRKALYEPVHGSAPDIAGKGVANPLACVLSFAMMLRYSFDMPDEAALVENAVRDTLAAGARTADIAQPGAAPVPTRAMGDAILRELEKARVVPDRSDRRSLLGCVRVERRIQRAIFADRLREPSPDLLERNMRKPAYDSQRRRDRRKSIPRIRSMPRRRSSVTTISGLLSPTLPTARLSNRWMREASLPLPKPLVCIGGSLRQYRVRDPHRTGRCDGKRGPLRSGIDRRGDLAVIELDREEQMAVDGRPADLDFGIGDLPIPACTCLSRTATFDDSADRDRYRTCRAHRFRGRRQPSIRASGVAIVATIARRQGSSTPPIVKLLNSTSRLGKEPPTP